MALKVGLVAAGMLMGVTVGAALGIHAQDEGDMGGADLTGEANNGESVGGIAPEVEAVTSPAPQPPESRDPTVGSPAQQSIWDTLARCESGGDWHSASNGRYKGGLQFDAPTWAAYGGLAFAWRADYASREQQIAVATRLRAERGYQPWPACSRRLGLR